MEEPFWSHSTGAGPAISVLKFGYIICCQWFGDQFGILSISISIPIHIYIMELTKSTVLQTSFYFLPVACNKVRKYDRSYFFQSWEFVNMFTGQLLCGIGRVHLESTSRLHFCSMPNTLIKNHKTPACAQWSRYLDCVDMEKVKCVMFNSWWTGTNNSKFHYLWDKGLCVVIIVKVKSKKMTSSYWIKAGIDLTSTY